MHADIGGRKILVRVVLFLSTSIQIHCQQKIFQVCAKEVEILPLQGQSQNLKLLRFLKYFNSDTAFPVFVSVLNENVHGFNNIRNGRVNTGFQIVKCSRV